MGGGGGKGQEKHKEMEESMAFSLTIDFIWTPKSPNPHLE